MSRGINKVILIGNLGRDPEVRYTTNGSAIANLNLATSEVWRDKQSGETQERTEWHRIILFNRLAEIAGEYLKKGSKIYVEGSLRTRKWQDKNGAEHYTTEIVGAELQMLDSRGSASMQAANNPNQVNQATTAAQNPQPTDTSSNPQGLDDDIPF